MNGEHTGQYSDGAAGFKAGSKPAVAQTGNPSLILTLFILTRAEPPRVGTCVIETLEVVGAARCHLRVQCSRNVSQGSTNEHRKASGNTNPAGSSGISRPYCDA